MSKIYCRDTLNVWVAVSLFIMRLFERKFIPLIVSPFSSSPFSASPTSALAFSACPPLVYPCSARTRSACALPWSAGNLQVKNLAVPPISYYMSVGWVGFPASTPQRFWNYLLPILPAWSTSSNRHSHVKTLTGLQVEFPHLSLLEWQ